MYKKTETRLPTNDEIDIRSKEWVSSFSEDDMNPSYVSSLAEAYAEGARWAVSESLRKRDVKIHPYPVLRNLDIGESVVFPKYAYQAARTAASKLKKDFGVVFTVKTLAVNKTYERFCIALRLQ